MTNGLADLINSFEGLSVVVIGDAMLDRYTRGAVDRVCPDAPVPIVRLGEEHNFAGGAANVAVNCRALGARTSLLTVVGDDPEASSLAGLLTAADVSTDWVHMSPQRRTLLKQRILAGSQLIVRLDWGTGDPLDRQNTRGEPIVCTPRDAVESFWTSPLDALAIGPFLLEKKGIAP